MPVPLIIGAVAVGVATASYLGPLVISCLVGALTTISAFFIAKSYYEKKEPTDLFETDQELINREKTIREDAIRTSSQVSHNVNLILKRSEEQQRQLGQQINRFNHSIEVTNDANTQLDIVSTSINEAVNTATNTVESLTIELDALKAELLAANTELRNTQDTLSSTNNDLKKTIEKLASSEALIANEMRKGADSVCDFTKSLSVAHDFLQQNNELNSIKDGEILALRAMNTEVSSAIKILETTISDLSRKFTDLSSINKSQLEEIQGLLSENTRLMCLINNLSQDLEEQESNNIVKTNTITKGYQTSIFK